jgi:hypothetical protein
LTSENLAKIIEHMKRDVKWFFTGPGAVTWGRPLRPSVLASRRDSSPVINFAPHHPDFEPLLDWAVEHHHRAKATA